MAGPMTNIVRLTRGQKSGQKVNKKSRQKTLLTEDGALKDPDHRRHAEGRMTPTLLPFVRPGSLHTPTYCRMLCVFYRILF